MARHTGYGQRPAASGQQLQPLAQFGKGNVHKARSAQQKRKAGKGGKGQRQRANKGPGPSMLYATYSHTTRVAVKESYYSYITIYYHLS
jgi:hypothetical protein